MWYTVGGMLTFAYVTWMHVRKHSQLTVSEMFMFSLLSIFWIICLPVYVVFQILDCNFVIWKKKGDNGNG